ncbi:hypothetical protein LTR70_007111 [Exophiala xenobiotica]|uniref:Uncharacterized protein n=1 Tax=Lithohypha guttulata TaxID=1690604 RepID=A0ABR0K694_9EURO|nr:hypothetical protein LTR24_006308 [Lithohypha guttulata]KAK5314482.1 hypothetical protein LTR70_007111 [Exophiala xenobiotica]
MSKEHPFQTSKEAIAFQLLMHVDQAKLHAEELTANNEALLKRQRVVLYHHLLELERDKCWDQVMTIADSFPKTVCRALDDLVLEMKESLLPLVEDSGAKHGNYMDKLSNDTEDDLRAWMGKCGAEAKALHNTIEKIRRHCRRLKLLEKLLWAYRDGNNELKTALRTL